MQKVYLLLRSNKQTGPYSLEELLQLNLKPFDLVWVNGRSAAWQYPFEIPALKPYVPETPHAEAPFKPIATEAMEEKQAPGLSFQQPQNPVPEKTEIPKRVFVSIPKTYTAAKEQQTNPRSYEPQPQQAQSNPVQHKAYMPPVKEPLPQRPVEIEQRDTSYTKMSQKPLGEEVVSTNYSRSLHEVEEDYTKWVYQQKAKKKVSLNPRDMVLAVLILAVIGGGYYVMSKPSVASSILPVNRASVPPTDATEEKADETQPKEILSPGQRVVTSPVEVTAPNQTKQFKNIKAKNPNSVSKTQTVSSVPPVQNSIPVEKTIPNIHEDNKGINSSEPQVKEQPKETTEKKKKFGEVLKGIFAKKDRKEDATTEVPTSDDPQPATNRQASRRDESAKQDENTNGQISTASLMEQVDLTSNAPDNWMLGVKNLKITLRNRSNATIQTASVTVSYYDENNQLLDKKLIYFSNVAPKARTTVAAPDHKFADHVDFKLTTISAKEDRYASN